MHGAHRREAVERVTEVLFGGSSIESLTDEDLALLAQEIPTTEPGGIIEVLVASGAVASNGEARRLMSSGAISVDGEKAYEDADVAARSLVKKGKNTFVLIQESEV